MPKILSRKNRNERKLVNELIKNLMINDQKLYTFIDRDCGSQRHTSSGWDFQLALNGTVVYCEAKIEKGKLSPWQILTQARIKNSGTPYRVMRFWDDGKFFTIDDGKKIDFLQAKFEDFI